MEFCADHGLDPFDLQGFDPVPFLQVFAARYRDGRIAPRGKPVRSGTVSEALRNVGQAYKSMGAPDIRLDSHGNIDFRLSRMLRKYTKEDPPPQRVKPVPIQLVVAIVNSAYTAPAGDMGFRTIADMICIGFFFLCRPGEHTYNKGNTPFKFADLRLFLGTRRVDWRHASIPTIRAVTDVQLVFTTQKNGVKGEIIAHGRSGDALACPVRAIIRRVLYARQANLPDSTPLCSYHDRTGKLRHVTAANISDALKAGLALVGPNTVDIQAHEIDARSLRAGGATALLEAGVDKDIIQLLGRWKSDAMIRYLHVMSLPVANQYASRMFHRGAQPTRAGFYVPALPLDAAVA